MNSKRIYRIKQMLAAILFAVLMSGAMCACYDANADIPSDREVLREVSNICESEEYELVSRVDISDGTPPACVEYTFVTKDRGLEFKARSTLRRFWCESASAWYTKVVTCDYEEVVQSLYINDVRDEIVKCPLYYPNDKSYYISSFAQIETVAESLAAAQEIYRQELQYNSAEFLRENHLFHVYLRVLKASSADCLSGSDIMSCVYEASHSDFIYIANMEVSIWEYDEIYDYLAMAVTDGYMEGDIYLEDEIPQEYIERWRQAQTDAEA